MLQGFWNSEISNHTIFLHIPNILIDIILELSTTKFLLKCEQNISIFVFKASSIHEITFLVAYSPIKWIYKNVPGDFIYYKTVKDLGSIQYSYINLCAWLRNNQSLRSTIRICLFSCLDCRFSWEPFIPYFFYENTFYNLKNQWRKEMKLFDIIFNLLLKAIKAFDIFTNLSLQNNGFHRKKRDCYFCNIRDSIRIFDLYTLLYKHVIADIFIVSTILFRLDNLKGTFISDVEGMCCVYVAASSSAICCRRKLRIYVSLCQYISILQTYILGNIAERYIWSNTDKH